MTDIVVEDREDRKLVPSFRQYFHFLKTEWDTFAWMFGQFTTPESRRHLRRMLALLVLTNACLIAQPAIIAVAINQISAAHPTGIMVAIGALVMCGALHHLFSTLEGAAREHVLGKNICQLDHRMSELLLSKPLGQHERHGRQLNYASLDKGKWKSMGLIDLIIFQGVPSATLCLLALGGLWIIRPEFGAVATVCTACFFTWSLWINYQVGYHMHPIEREFRRINRTRIERWEKAQRVITNGTAKREIGRMDIDMRANMEKDRVFWTWLIAQFNIRSFLMQRSLGALALAWGAYLVLTGDWQLGYLFPLLMWTDILNNHLLVLSHVERQIARDIVPIQLMCEALQLPPTFDVRAGKPLVRNGPLKVSFLNLSYSYEDEGGKEHPVLRNLSLIIKPGERVALLGPSGAGKTTLMKLLLRYDDPTKGIVLINDKPLHGLELASYMRQVGYIPQQAMIFDTTIGENLLYGASHRQRDQLLADDARELWSLMQSLRIDFGPRLDRGLDTFVGHHGLRLSGGQAQRVMIGAAVAKQPRLMVIDEATSSLDSTTEKEVQEGLASALRQGTTALIVAHRLSTVRHLCDRFVVLRPLESLREGESQIEATASSFEELAALSPTFRRLAHDQGVQV
jgi:ABC-type multidrug transport system fused ATPase/permease subunit